MRISEHVQLVASTFLIGGILAVSSVVVVTQAREPVRGDLSGRWELNADASENAYAKLDAMHSANHGAGRHSFGAMFGGAPDAAQIQEARALFTDAPPWFFLETDGERITLTYDDGRVRRLTASGRKEVVGGRNVRTWWDQPRLVSEIAIGNIKITDTYERSGQQLIVTSRMGMAGREVAVRRVYEAGHSR
jgi:hypothetical protein